MDKKYKVLWIEDAARHDLPQLAAPVYMDGGYDLVIAEDVSEGAAHLLRSEFDVVIIDIRLPPGNGRAWIELFLDSGNTKTSARLGLKLLYNILGQEPVADYSLVRRNLKWIAPEKIGVFTIESYGELKEDLERLGIQSYSQKHAETSEGALLDFIRQIIERQESTTEDTNATSD